MSECNEHDIEESDDEEFFADSAYCVMCGGQGNFLGRLGEVTYYRCRNCGIDFHEHENGTCSVGEPPKEINAPEKALTVADVIAALTKNCKPELAAGISGEDLARWIGEINGVVQSK